MRFVFFSFLLLFIFLKPNELLSNQTEIKKQPSFQDAEALFYAQKTNIALPLLENLCEKNSPKACALLGFAYYSDRFGVKKDIEKTLFWYEKCALKEKDNTCKKELARIHYLQANYEKAFELYESLAKKSDPQARYWLGYLYKEGKGKRNDYAKALYWLRLSAHARKNPSQQAQCELLKMSYFAIGLKRTMKDVNYWLKLCENPQVEAFKHFFGHSVPKNQEKAKQIAQKMYLNEMLEDWDSLLGKRTPLVGKKSLRDNHIMSHCVSSFPEEAHSEEKKENIKTYVVKIFNKDFYRDFNVHNTFVKNIGIGDQTFEACGKTFYTNPEEKRLFLKSLRQGDLIRIFQYSDVCLSAEITEVCDLNLDWNETQEDTLKNNEKEAIENKKEGEKE